MAKLKARGREEIFRVSYEKATPGDREVAREKNFRAFTSDGNVLERRVIWWREGGSHDYGWKVRGKAKPERNVEELLKSYLDRGWHLEDANRGYFNISGNTITAISHEPLRTEAGAAREKAAREKRAMVSKEKRERAAAEEDGPGFYVVNRYTGNKPFVADHPKPFQDYEKAREFAEKRLHHLTVEFDFSYLLPVMVVLAENRRQAEWGEPMPDTWWINGKHKGPAPDPRQQHFGFYA